MIYSDNTLVEIGGAKGRAICAANRPGMRGSAVRALGQAIDPMDIAWPITEEGEGNERSFRFETRPGDVSSNDGPAYKGREKDTPKRAMITLESLGGTPRSGLRITQHFDIMIEPGPILREGWWTVLAQENQAPGQGLPWRPPGMEFGIIVKNHPDPKRADRPLKDATGRPLLFEHFVLKTHISDGKGGEKDAGLIVSKNEIVRGQRYSIALAYVDGRGGKGLLELWTGKGGSVQLQGRYDGETGYAGYGSPYPAFGVYQPPAQPSLAVHFYGWREGAKAA